MRIVYPGRILLLMLMFFCHTAMAQTPASVCEGSLGDPVFTIDFGSGRNPGAPLPVGYTNLTYANICPEGAIYAIVNNTNILNGVNNCHPGAWENVTHDHTGNPNGYMMLINASSDPSIFFQKTTDPVLCGNTTYEFSAYILNMMTVAGSNSGTRQPDIEFSIETTDGQVLAHTEKNIDPSTGPEDWVKAGLYFTTLANTTQVVLKMTNKTIGDAGNDLVLDDITFRACGPLVQTFFNNTGDNRVQNMCAGDNKTYLLKTIPVGIYAHPTLQWQQNINDGGWNDIANATMPNYYAPINNASVGSYKFRLAVAEGDNIHSLNCRVYSEPLIVNIGAMPVIPSMPPRQVCTGDALTVTASGGVSYEWHGPGITAANKNQNPLRITNAQVSDGGSYSVDVTSAGGCVSSSNKFAVDVFLKPVISLNQTEVTICKGASASIGVLPQAGVNYSWSPVLGLSNSTGYSTTVSPTDTSTYTVVATNAAGCTDIAYVIVNVLAAPVANAGPNKKIFEGQSVTLSASASNGEVFNWTPATGLNDAHILNPVATPTDDITYTLTVSSNNNCGTGTGSVFVKVYKKIGVPNSFTPNGDGVNDTWEIEALETYPQSELTVVNRYGQTVFTSKGYAKPWRATYNGSILPMGTYYYAIDLKNGAPKLSGWVLLIK
jgi:gliding motility-associated-like protein